MTDLEKIYLVEHYWELDRYISENIYELEDYRGTEIFQENVLKWGIIGTIIAALLAIIGVLIFGNKGGGYSSGGGGGSSSSSSSSAQNTAKARVLDGNFEEAIRVAQQKGDNQEVRNLRFRQLALSLMITLKNFKNLNKFFEQIDSFENMKYKLNDIKTFLNNQIQNIESNTGKTDEDANKKNELKKTLDLLEKYQKDYSSETNLDHALLVEWCRGKDGKLNKEIYEEFKNLITKNLEGLEFDYKNMIKELTLQNPRQGLIASVEVNTPKEYEDFKKKFDSEEDDETKKKFITDKLNEIDRIYLYPAFDATIVLFYLILIAANIFVIYQEKYSKNNDPKIKNHLDNLKKGIENLLTFIAINNINCSALIQYYIGVYNYDALNKPEVSRSIQIKMVNGDLPSVNQLQQMDKFIDFDKVFSINLDDGDIKNLMQLLKDQNNIISFNSLNAIDLAPAGNESILNIPKLKLYTINAGEEVQFSPSSVTDNNAISSKPKQTGLSNKELKAIHELFKKYFINGVQTDQENLKLLGKDTTIYPAIKTEIDNYRGLTNSHQRIQDEFSKRLEKLNKDAYVVEEFIMKQMAFFEIAHMKYKNEFNLNKIDEFDKVFNNEQNISRLKELYTDITNIAKKDLTEQAEQLSTNLMIAERAKANVDYILTLIENRKNDLNNQLNTIKNNNQDLTKDDLLSKATNAIKSWFSEKHRIKNEEFVNQITKLNDLMTKIDSKVVNEKKNIINDLKHQLSNLDINKDENGNIQEFNYNTNGLKAIQESLGKKIEELNKKKAELKTLADSRQIDLLSAFNKAKTKINSIIPSINTINPITDLTSKSTTTSSSSDVQVSNGTKEPGSGGASSGDVQGKMTDGNNTPTPTPKKPQIPTSNTILQKLEANPNKIPEIFSKWLQGEDVKNLQNEIKRWESSTQNK